MLRDAATARVMEPALYRPGGQTTTANAPEEAGRGGLQSRTTTSHLPADVWDAMPGVCRRKPLRRSSALVCPLPNVQQTWNMAPSRDETLFLPSKGGQHSGASGPKNLWTNHEHRQLTRRARKRYQGFHT